MTRCIFPLLLAACLFSSLFKATAQVTFTDQKFATGPAPTAVVSGDFNRDGWPDLAVADQQANRVTILLGAGGGQFAFGADYNTGTTPIRIVTGDFNRDGTLDLAVANSGENTITILLGNGDGTFHSGTSIALTANALAIAAVAFNRDGTPDLAVIERSDAPSFSLNIYRATGRGTFRRTQTIPLPPNPFSFGVLVTGDFNVDGVPDVALAIDKTVMVFAGSPDGTVHLATSFDPPQTRVIAGLAVGDFNGDAAADLVVRVFDDVNDTSFPNSEYVFLNSGSGTFSVSSRVPAGGFVGFVYVTDINGDLRDDLISVGGNFRNAGFEYALGHGDGTFEPPVFAASGTIGSPGGFVARDLNLDSRHDLAITSIGQLGNGLEATHVFLNQDAGTNCAPPDSSTLAVRVCSPEANATVPSTLTVAASGNSPAGVKRMELWVDGVKRAQNFSDQLNATISLPSGSHELTLVGVDLFDDLVKSRISVQVP
jgi:FG-GAP-like repeat/Bacterial Ig domain/FG-GAP repeat